MTGFNAPSLHPVASLRTRPVSIPACGPISLPVCPPPSSSSAFHSTRGLREGRTRAGRRRSFTAGESGCCGWVGSETIDYRLLRRGISSWMDSRATGTSRLECPGSIIWLRPITQLRRRKIDSREGGLCPRAGAARRDGVGIERDDGSLLEAIHRGFYDRPAPGPGQTLLPAQQPSDLLAHLKSQVCVPPKAQGSPGRGGRCLDTRNGQTGGGIPSRRARPVLLAPGGSATGVEREMLQHTVD